MLPHFHEYLIREGSSKGSRRDSRKAIKISPREKSPLKNQMIEVLMTESPTEESLKKKQHDVICPN